jgi:hypothetical protein
MNAFTDWLSKYTPDPVENLLTQRVAPALGKVASSPLGLLMTGLNEGITETVRRPIGTVALTGLAALPGGNKPITPREAYNATERISYGEAIANLYTRSPFVQPFVSSAGTVAKAIGKKDKFDNVIKNTPLLNPNYNVLDEKQRLEAQDNAAYQFFTGLTDIGVDYFVGGKGLGYLTQTAKVQSGLTRIPSTQKTINDLANDFNEGKAAYDESVTLGTEFYAPNGASVHIYDALKETDPLKLLANPYISKSNSPNFMARAAAEANTWDEVAALFGAENGIPSAMLKLEQIAPSWADRVKVNKEPIDLTPIGPDDLGMVDKPVSIQESASLKNVLDDIIRRDPTLKDEWQNWYSNVESGVVNLSYAPSRFTFVEKLNSGLGKANLKRLIGYEDAIKETIIGGGMLRPFKILTLATTRLRPTNWIKLSGVDNPMDEINEISAYLNSFKTLRNEKYADFRKDVIRSYITNASDETSRAIAVANNVEKTIITKVAEDLLEQYNIKDVNATELVEGAVKQLQDKRQLITAEARINPEGIVSKNPNGEVLVVDRNIKSKLADSMPLLDAYTIENALRQEISASKPLLASNIVRSTALKLDALERHFSAAVLIRPGYIPKQSLFEPFIRTVGLTHSHSLEKLLAKDQKLEVNYRDLDLPDGSQMVSKEISMLGSNIPGGGALAAELNPALTLSNVVQPGRWETSSASKLIGERNIIPNTPKNAKLYWPEYAKQIQSLKNDPIFIQLLEGRNSQQIVQYLLRDLDRRGAQSDLNRLAVARSVQATGPMKGVVDTSPEAALFFVEEGRKVIDGLLPDDAIRKTVLEMDKPITDKIAKDLMAGKKPPILRVKNEDPAGLMSRAISKSFNIMAAPERILFRSRVGTYFANEAMKTFQDNAKRLNIEVTGDVWNSWRREAQQYAASQTNSVFYTIKRMNNFQYYSRFMFGFPTAMFNSIKYWTKAGFNNPYNFALLEQIRTSPWAMGMVVDEEGNKISYEEADRYNKASYLVLPFFNKTDRVTPYRYKLNTDQFNFLTNGPSPSWLGQVALNTLITAAPSVETMLKKSIGEKLYNRVIYGGIPKSYVPGSQQTQGGSALDVASAFVTNVAEQVFVPGAVLQIADLGRLGIAEIVKPKSGTGKAFLGSELEFRNDAVANTLWAIHTARMVNWESNNPDEPQPDLDKSVTDTFKHLGARLATKLFGFAGTGLSVTNEPTANLYRSEYDRIEKNLTDNPAELARYGGLSPADAALQEYIIKFGEESTKFLIPGTKSTVSISPEQEAVRRLGSYNWLEKWVSGNAEKRVNVIGIVLNPALPGEYSPAASAYLKTSSISGIPIGLGTKSFVERQAEAEIEDGWREYNQIIADQKAKLAGRPSKSLTARVNYDIWLDSRDKLYNEETGLVKRNTAWADNYGDQTTIFNESINLIDVALNDTQHQKDMAKSPYDKQLWDTIKEWSDARKQVFNQWNTLPVNSVQRKQLVDQWETQVYNLTSKNTYFADFAARWLTGDPIIDMKSTLSGENQQRLQQPSTVSPLPGAPVVDLNNLSLFGGQ